MSQNRDEEVKKYYRAAVPSYQSSGDIDQFKQTEAIFHESAGSLIEKLDAFPKFCTRKSMARFLSRYEIMKKILPVNGSIVECGVLHGGGLFTWAKLSSIFEPFNHTRRIIGFDTFEGFPSVEEVDKHGQSGVTHQGALHGSSMEEIERATKLFDLNRPLSHIPKIELVKGDLSKTAFEYVEKNPHLVVSLLYLDCDIYSPTKAALEAFLPRMPKGSIVAFDELNASSLPGETAAVNEVMGLNKISIERFPHDSYFSYCVLT